MASGTITGSFTGGSSSSRFTYRLDWSSSKGTGLTSNVTLNWYVVCSSSGYRTYKANSPWSETVDGASSSGTENFNYPNPVTLTQNEPFLFRSESLTIPHDPNGAKSFTVTGSINLSGTSAGTGSLSGTITLDTIATTPPTITSFTVADAGTGNSKVGAFVEGFTKFKFTVKASAASPATLASYSFYRDATLIETVASSATTLSYTIPSFETAGTYVFKVVVKDSYGNTKESTLASKTVLAYSKPSITATTFRCNSGGTASNEGTYGSCKMVYSVSAVGSNSATTHTVAINGTTYTLTSGTAKVVSGLATTTTYTATYTVTDKLGVTSTATGSVQVSFINFDMYPSSNGGVAIGEAAQENKFIVNQSESIFRGSVNIAVPLAIASGGTGGMTVVNHSLTTTAYSYGNYTSKTYTVSGSGILIVSCTTKTDATDSYGITVATVRKNGTMVAYATDRIEPAVAQEVAANAVVTISVANGDTVFLGGFSTKVGTKTFLFNILCFGCTVS